MPNMWRLVDRLMKRCKARVQADVAAGFSRMSAKLLNLPRDHTSRTDQIGTVLEYVVGGGCLALNERA